MKRVAECCCGKLSIVVSGEPKYHGVCHCNDCKKRTGSAFGISTYFPIENILSKNGEANCYELHNAELAHDQKRFFCGSCGTTLYWSISSSPDLLGIAGGCFVKDRLCEPTYSVSHGNKCAWVSLPKDWNK